MSDWAEVWTHNRSFLPLHSQILEGLCDDPGSVWENVEILEDGVRFWWLVITPGSRISFQYASLSFRCQSHVSQTSVTDTYLATLEYPNKSEYFTNGRILQWQIFGKPPVRLAVLLIPLQVIPRCKGDYSDFPTRDNPTPTGFIKWEK